METQDISFNLDFSTGIHNNTIFKNGKLQLQEVGVDSLGQIVYAESGYWISSSIQFADKFKEFKPFQSLVEQLGDSSYKISVSSSENNIIWTEFVETDVAGNILNSPSPYIKIRVDLAAEKGHSEYETRDFTEAIPSNQFVDSTNGIIIKRNYEYLMTKDNTWSDDGALHRKSITRSDWLRIDTLDVVRVVE